MLISGCMHAGQGSQDAQYHQLPPAAASEGFEEEVAIVVRISSFITSAGGCRSSVWQHVGSALSFEAGSGKDLQVHIVPSTIAADAARLELVHLVQARVANGFLLPKTYVPWRE